MAVITDDFNRADANPAGGNWSTLSGYNVVQIISQKLCSSSSGGDSGAYWNAATPGANQFVQYTISALTAGLAATWGLILRLNDGVGTMYQAQHVPSIPRTQILKIITGTPTAISGEDTTPWQLNDVIYFEVNGTNLTLKRNGGTILTVSNGDITAAGSIGVRIPLFTGAAGSDSIDDFSGGDLGSTNLMAQICL